MTEMDHSPISEGIFHGPIPLPEDIEHHPLMPTEIMKISRNDPGLYQLLMLRESIEADHRRRKIDETVYESNVDRLERAIGHYIAETNITPMTEWYRS